jgi:hypothetical protein
MLSVIVLFVNSATGFWFHIHSCWNICAMDMVSTGSPKKDIRTHFVLRYALNNYGMVFNGKCKLVMIHFGCEEM